MKYHRAATPASRGHPCISNRTNAAQKTALVAKSEETANR